PGGAAPAVCGSAARGALRVMGNLLGSLFVTLRWAMYYRVQAIWGRSWGICLGSWMRSTRAPTDPVSLSPVVCSRDLQEEPCPGEPHGRMRSACTTSRPSLRGDTAGERGGLRPAPAVAPGAQGCRRGGHVGHDAGSASID